MTKGFPNLEHPPVAIRERQCNPRIACLLSFFNIKNNDLGVFGERNAVPLRLRKAKARHLERRFVYGNSRKTIRLSRISIDISSTNM